MSEQTVIPVPLAPAPLSPCRWCGEPAVGTVEVEPARYRNDRGTRVVAKAALMMPACKDHVGAFSRANPN